MTKDEALKMALETLEELDGIDTETECVTIDVGGVMTAVREALAERPAQQQEPVAWVSRTGHGTYFRESITTALEALEFGGNKMWTPLYTSPPQRNPWVGLTEEEFQFIYDKGNTPAGMMEMVEAKLKEKNT